MYAGAYRFFRVEYQRFSRPQKSSQNANAPGPSIIHDTYKSCQRENPSHPTLERLINASLPPLT